MSIHTRAVFGIAVLFAAAAVVLGILVSVDGEVMVGQLALATTALAAAGLIYVTVRFK